MKPELSSGAGEMRAARNAARPEDVLTREEQDELRRRAAGGRLHVLAKELGITRETVLRLAGGFGVRRCTLVAVRAMLAGTAAP